MKNKFDVIVIGTGSGGLSVGLSMHELGFKVLFIEKFEGNIGGECLNSGCVPSKALIHVAKRINAAREASKFGIEAIGRIDFRKVREYLDEKQSKIRDHENAEYYRQKGIQIEIGIARFASKDSVQVNGKEFFAKKIIVATGSKARKLDVLGASNVPLYDNENIFKIDKVPGKLLVIGAGPIGIELAQAFCRLGSQVTVINNGSEILKKEHPTISAVLKKKLEQEGIVFLNNAEIKSFEETDIAVVKVAGNEKRLKFDIALVGIGRETHLNELALDKAGIRQENGRLKVDKYLRTTNKNVLAAGDVAGPMNFSHAAELHASIIINNFLSPVKKTLNYYDFSWVTFTDPEIATFGLSEETLKEKNISYEKLEYDFQDDDRAIIDSYEYSKMVLFLKKGILNKRNNKILGGSMVSPNAGGMIQELILAKTQNLGIKDIFDKTYPYPVSERVNKLAVVKKYQNELTPFIRKALKFLFNVMN